MRFIKDVNKRQAFRQLMSNWGLLILLTFTIFVLPIITTFWQFRLFEIFITLIVLVSIYATSEDSKSRVLLQVIVAIGAIWVTRIADLTAVNYLSSLWLVVFFLLRVFRFIKHLSNKQEVNGLVIVEAINGYLLIGVGFGILVNMMAVKYQGAFNFTVDSASYHVYDAFYYTFVSMTTLGYGDLLPVIPLAKSLALLITLCGQFYLVIIMALLVGRLISGMHKN